MAANEFSSTTGAWPIMWPRGMMYSYRKIEDRFTRDTATRLVALRYQIPRDVRYMLRQPCRLHDEANGRSPVGNPMTSPAAR